MTSEKTNGEKTLDEKTTGEKADAESGAGGVGLAAADGVVAVVRELGWDRGMAKLSVADKVLSLLREWGWETGLAKLKAEAGQTGEEDRPTMQLFLAWMEGERGAHAEALKRLEALEQWPALLGWSLAGRAYVTLRKKVYPEVHQLLDQAAQNADGDKLLEAAIRHCRGALAFHQNRPDEALRLLHESLELYEAGHFGMGRVLDTMGQVYAAKNKLHAARAFHELALGFKERYGDSAGVALSHGQLGRLYLELGNYTRACEHFNRDLEIARLIGDERGEAQMYNYLGQAALARQDWEEAAAWLDESIRLMCRGEWSNLEGFARKDRALAHLGRGEVELAAEQAGRALRLFEQTRFEEGRAHAERALGMVLRAQGDYAGSEQELRKAARWFEEHGEQVEATRTQLETARTLRARNAPRPLIRNALMKALERAERCRRDALAREIESELKAVDELAHYRHVYRRTRGREVKDDTVSLQSGEREAASVLFLDVQGSTDFARSNDPEVVMMTLNEMMAEFEAVLERHDARVTAYLGDGFMALLRGPDHARRAVASALEMVAALREFNQPREILGLRPLNVRVGISSGEVFIGNVGTYHKMDYTAIGTTANLAARLQSEAEPGLPCVSRPTFELVRDQFEFRTEAPRLVKPKGLGEREAWDVTGEKR